MKISIFWFRRDLRLVDNIGLHHALQSGLSILPIFIFDSKIINGLEKDDGRVNFIYEKLGKINADLKNMGSSLLCLNGDPTKVWENLIDKYEIAEVYTNRDYEPYAIKRDQAVRDLLKKNGIEFHSYKDQVIFEQSEIVKGDGKPYTIFTPYKNKWLEHFDKKMLHLFSDTDFKNLYPVHFNFPTLADIGFIQSSVKVPDYDLSALDSYADMRNFPFVETTHIGPHLRFGTISIRRLIAQLNNSYDIFLSELIWREFFMQILYHFPKVVDRNFKQKYDGIEWRNNEAEFKKWCDGETGYPMVDAGMRQLNNTGFMHNRVRMVTASFLCKHLLIDWRWGESYFAERLLDYELASNNGNWQWAAGTGCDAAPYFRIFNPEEQLKKFDKELKYTKKWVPEYGTKNYAPPMVDHAFARKRAMEVYKKGIESGKG